jgi:hypothetical protein
MMIGLSINWEGFFCLIKMPNDLRLQGSLGYINAKKGGARKEDYASFCFQVI